MNHLFEQISSIVERLRFWGWRGAANFIRGKLCNVLRRLNFLVNAVMHPMRPEKGITVIGRAFEAAWRSQSDHFHALLYCNARGGCGGPPPTSGHGFDCGLLPRGQVAQKYTRESGVRDLPYAIGLFKSWTTTLYHRLKEAGKCVDIGPRLWQSSFYDELVRSEAQFKNTAIYIRKNPDKWNFDRFGSVTSFADSNLDLLQSAYVAYLSSEGFKEGTPKGTLPMTRYDAREVAREHDAEGMAGKPPVISTFTSYYERQVLARCIKAGRSFIWVCPGGIGKVPADVRKMLDSGNALAISPVEPETGVNKQRAIWCNQFIAKNAREIWVGHIRMGGTLEAILSGCRRGGAE